MISADVYGSQMNSSSMARVLQFIHFQEMNFGSRIWSALPESHKKEKVALRRLGVKQGQSALSQAPWGSYVPEAVKARNNM